jgi:hypothetical protein
MWPRLLLPLALVLGCAGPGAVSRPPPEPPAVTAAPVLPRWPVVSPEGPFTAEVEGLEAPTLQPREDALVLSVPVGPPSPLTCFVYRAPEEVGALLHRWMARAAGHRRVRSARITDVRLLAEAPTVFAELAYRADSPGGPAADGRVRLMVHGHPRAPLACLLDSADPAVDFTRLAEGLVRSARHEAEPPLAPRASEFHVLRVREQPVGFEWRVVREAPQAGRLTRSVTSLFFPRAVWELTAQDSVTTEHTDAAGALLAREDTRAVNGEADLRLSLVRGEAGASLVPYHVEGRAQGQDVRGDFAVPGGLASEAVAARVRRELLEGRGPDTVTLQLYLPEAQPLGPVPQRLRRGAPGSRELEAELGGGLITLQLDAQGGVERLVMPLGEGLQLVRERVTVTGPP